MPNLSSAFNWTLEPAQLVNSLPSHWECCPTPPHPHLPKAIVLILLHHPMLVQLCFISHKFIMLPHPHFLPSCYTHLVNSEWKFKRGGGEKGKVWSWNQKLKERSYSHFCGIIQINQNKTKVLPEWAQHSTAFPALPISPVRSTIQGGRLTVSDLKTHTCFL